MAKKQQSKSNSQKVNKCTLYVEGMHCPACEILIEKKLLDNKQIKSVDASLKDSKVKISYQGASKLTPADLSKQFEDLGYTFSDQKLSNNSKIFSLKDGQLVANKKNLTNLSKNIFILTALLIVFYLFEKLQLGKYVSIDASSSLPAFFVLGIVAALSSCAALVGGLLLSMTKQWNELYVGESNKSKAQPHILFHAGRLISFFLFGGILGLIGEIVSLDNTIIYSVFVIVISVVMLVLAMQMLGVEWAQKIRLTAPKSLSTYVASEQNFTGKYMPTLVGALTFFLPCGFTLIAQSVALSSGNFLSGGLIMLMFALGALPVLAGISLAGLQFNKRPHLTAKFNFIAGILVVFFAIYNLNGQLNVLGLTSLSDFSLDSTVTESPSEEPVDSEEGVQILKFIANGFSYTPSGSTTLEADKPAKLIVDNLGIQGCGRYIASRGLIDGYVELKSGKNEIDLGVVKKGTYKLTCSMGMVPPVNIYVK